MPDDDALHRHREQAWSPQRAVRVGLFDLDADERWPHLHSISPFESRRPAGPGTLLPPSTRDRDQRSSLRVAAAWPRRPRAG